MSSTDLKQTIARARELHATLRTRKSDPVTQVDRIEAALALLPALATACESLEQEREENRSLRDAAIRSLEKRTQELLKAEEEIKRLTSAVASLDAVVRASRTKGEIQRLREDNERLKTRLRTVAEQLATNQNPDETQLSAAARHYVSKRILEAMNDPPCHCAETSTRNCPEHQNRETK